MAKTKTIRVSEEIWTDLKNMCTTLEQKANNNREVTITATIELLLSEYNWQHSEQYKKQKESTLRHQYVPKYQHETILEEQKDDYRIEKEKLQKTISDRDTGIDELKKSNTILVEQVNELTQQKSDKETEHNDYVSETNDLINQKYIDKDQLKNLYAISCVLFEHKNNWYSVGQIDTMLWKLNVSEISDCLSLLPLDIIPIESGKTADEILVFRYNNQYLL